jgi:hypothetical protein
MANNALHVSKNFFTSLFAEERQKLRMDFATSQMGKGRIVGWVVPLEEVNNEWRGLEEEWILLRWVNCWLAA